MMKKNLPVLISVLLCITSTGCATMSNLTAIDTGTALSSANYHYVKTVEGTAYSAYLLGLFGGDNARDAIIDAKAKAQLKNNQALANVAVVNKTQFLLFGLIIKVTTTITADVVEFEQEE